MGEDSFTVDTSPSEESFAYEYDDIPQYETSRKVIIYRHCLTRIASVNYECLLVEYRTDQIGREFLSTN